MHISKLLLALLCLTALLIACSADPAELLDTAQLEERQHNPAHAMELYEEIVAKHPHSEAAEVARARLEVLRSQDQ
jgi:regulator of sirC expression with transglutaminase-like and TPR domain